VTRSARALWALVIIAPGACAQTLYQDYQVENDSGALGTRIVRREIDPDFAQKKPQCVAIVAGNTMPGPVLDAIALAMVQLASLQFDRVFNQEETTARFVSRGLDSARVDHRQRFAQASGCAGLLEWTLTDDSNLFALVWTRRRLGISVSLWRDGDALLWRADHVVARTDGGLPLGLIAAPVAGYRATTFAYDSDVLPSLAYDVARRVFGSLQPPRSRNAMVGPTERRTLP